MRIEKFNATQLKIFLESEEYKAMPFVPVSNHRAQSWLNNPRIRPEDVIMYLGYEEEDMIAYCTIMPDRHSDIRFGWVSGIWARPDQRRKGLASRLFEEAYIDWGHQLMYTNYAPEAKALFTKSGHFDLFYERSGIRYYQRSSLADLLGNRNNMYRRSRLLLSMADGVLNTVQDIRIRMKRKEPKDIQFEENSSVDYEAMDFLENNAGTGFCLRGMEEFDWIIKYPWIEVGSEKDIRYFFSSVSPDFRNICIKIRESGESMAGFLWMVINGDKMILPYASFKEGANLDISGLLNHYLQVNRISYFTTYQSDVIKIFQPGPMLGSRKMMQNYFSTRELRRQLPDSESIKFQDGDGDVVFV
ncbi:GNAT family N-acetyltransferase [Bacteroidota bacterium]